MIIDFKAHNILLPNGKKTLPWSDKILSERPVMNVIRNSLINFTNTTTKEERKNIRLVDIGCMEGGYSAEFARMGFDTLGIDARKENLLKAMYIKLNLNLPNLNFVVDDARNISNHGKFDISFCFGLLYHLDCPVNFLRTVSNNTKKILILHTYYAPENDFLYKVEFKLNSIFPNFFKKKRKEFSEREANKERHTSYIQHIKNFRLSDELSTNEGYKGRWFREWHKERDRKDIEIMPGASYNNHQSFWLCKNDLMKSLYDVGFKSVYEQHDDIGDLTDENPRAYYPRVLLIAVK